MILQLFESTEVCLHHIPAALFWYPVYNSSLLVPVDEVPELQNG